MNNHALAEERSKEKASLLRSIAPLFPDVRDTEARLQAIEAAFPAKGHDELRYSRKAEEIFFPLWQSLAAAYAATVAAPSGQDPITLATRIEHWPATLATQQLALQDLLERSELRQGWRDHVRWCESVDGASQHPERKVIAERRYESSCTPLREIPLFMGGMRVACQQLVCLPLEQWQALNDPQLAYEPERVDPSIVDRLAARVAQVFNAPPFVDVDLLRDSLVWDDPVVWTLNASNLTASTSGHGMRDRCEQGWRGELVPLAADTVAPHLRYLGFFGQIRVTMESGEDWMVIVLAPMHFVFRLSHCCEWYRRHADGR